ncbi:prolyl oligopeptidase family serine peptidase [bacterium]|nr:prolyl oligopeptidase family serine peptidase [bacterium]
MTPAGTHTIEATWEGESRPTIVHVPPGSPPTNGWPLVLAFHGRNIDADAMVRLSGLSEVADRRGFVVAYPSGRLDRTGGRYWLVDYTSRAVVTGSAEIPYVLDTLDRVAEEFGIDRSRVVASGFSNGAILAYAVSRWAGDHVAAVAGVAGMADFGEFTLDHPLRLLHIHGTRDRFVPYEGGRTARKDVPIDFPPVPGMLQRWLNALGSTAPFRQQRIVDPVDPILQVLIDDYDSLLPGSSARIVTIENGGHTWPGRPPLVSYLGKWTHAISAAELIGDLVT